MVFLKMFSSSELSFQPMTFVAIKSLKKNQVFGATQNAITKFYGFKVLFIYNTNPNICKIL
jgi:hypothetical protein